MFDFFSIFSEEPHPLEIVDKEPKEIGLVWHSAKEYTAHREFTTKEELEELVNKLLNEGELIIN